MNTDSEAWNANQLLIERIQNTYPNRLETPYNTFLRAERVKNFLKYYSENSSNTGKIFVVGHIGIFKFMTAQDW